MTDTVDISFFILNKEKATWTDLENQFVKGPKELHIARQTLLNYLHELIRKRVVKKVIDPKTLGPVYQIDETMKGAIKVMEAKRKLWEAINSASAEKIPVLKQLFEDMDRLELKQLLEIRDNLDKATKILVDLKDKQ